MTRPVNPTSSSSAMTRRTRPPIGRAPPPRLLLLATAAIALALLLNPTRAAVSPANPLTPWVAAAQDAVRANSLPNFIATRAYALVGLASLRAIDEHGRTIGASAAASLASHAVLSALFPWAQSSTYDGLLSAQLRPGGNASLPPPKTREQIRAASTDLVLKTPLPNSWDADFAFAPAGTLWRYQRAPMQNSTFMPQLGDGAPLVMSSSRLAAIAANVDPKRGPVFRPPKPLTGDYATTYKFGNATSTVRTPYDTASAMFWVAGSNTSNIGGYWLSIAWSVLPSDLGVRDASLFLARAFGAAYDANLVGYRLKYDLLQWRPVSAFATGYPEQQGSVPARKPDPNWRPLLPMTPPHPEYVSGHSTTVGAVLEVLLMTLEQDVAFTTRSEGAGAVVGERRYPSLTAAAVEVGDSRVFGGVHFNHSCVDGLRLGRLVGKEAFGVVEGGRGGAGAAWRRFPFGG